MPIKTKHYLLEAFLDGDAYLAIADKRRFSTVDNQLYRLAEIIDDGRIDGWEIEEYAFPYVILTAGRGFIDKFYVNTYDDKILELSPNGTFYIYAQRRIGVVGAIGPKSEVQNITYYDTGPPAAPMSLNATSSDPFSVILDWDDNTESDLSHYEIERSDGEGYVLIASVTQSIYEDTTDEDTTYNYRVYAVDLSGNRSEMSTTSLTTALSTDLPPNPVNVSMPPSEAAINILWTRPVSIPLAKIDHYEIEYAELNSDNSEISSTRTFKNVNRDVIYDRIDDLKIGQRYRVTIRTIDTKSRQSTGVTFNVVTLATPAPRDPQGIAYSIQESPGGVQVNLSWTDGDTPYDPAVTFRYKIYVTVEGQRESLGIDVPIGFIEEQISLYTFNLVEYFPIPENTLVTFRLTALDQTGFESFGNYIRFETSTFSSTLRIRDLTANFDANSGTIIVDWRNQPDTDNIRIEILKDNLEDSYVFDESIVNVLIGRAERYVLTDVLLNTKYTIRVTPLNREDVEGPTSVVVETTLIPGGLPLPEPPILVEAKTNDRQVALTWSDSQTLYTREFNIYKKSGGVTLEPDDWSLIDTLPSNISRFNDFGLQNDDTYSYYITAVDIYGRESLHLTDGAVNLNFVEATPRAEGNLTEPEIISVTLNSENQVVVVWESLLEEFDAFTLYRSVNNLHSWEVIATLSRDTFSYTDIELPLVDGTVFYYTIDKSINDSDIVVQTTSIDPENSLFLAKVLTNDERVLEIDVTDRRDIKDLIDPLAEYTSRFLLPHKHKEISPNDPDRIDLNSELIVTDWTTVDGRIFTTEEEDINGTSFIVKINNRFPSTFYTVDAPTRRLIFSEPIVELDPETGEITGEIPSIEVRVLGMEEVDGVLDNNRFDNLHARQVKYGDLNKEQLPEINHEGRIREKMLPKRFLLERFNNYNFIVPQGNTDSSKSFGDGTTFYCVTESEGQIEQIFDFDLNDNGSMVGFNKPSVSDTTINNLKRHAITGDIESDNDIANDYQFNSDQMYIMNASNFWSINKTTLEKDLVASVSLTDLEAITLDSRNNIAYILQSTSGGSHTLSTFDIGKGEIVTSVSLSPGVSKTIREIEYNPDDNSIYGTVQFSGVIPNTHELITINPSTGAITTIGTIDPQAGGANVTVHLAYDEDSNVMYGINGAVAVGESRLFTVNLTTAATTVVGTTGLTTQFEGLTFDYSTSGNSALYGITLTQLAQINTTTGAATVIGAHGITGVAALVAAPKDKSFYMNPADGVPGSSRIRLGNFYGFSSTTYLRFPVNVEQSYSISEALIDFTAHTDNSSGNNVRLQLSILDPSEYQDSTTLSSESISAVSTLGNIVWAPLIWSSEENSDNTTVNVTSLVQTFVDHSSFFNGRHIIFKITTLDTTTKGNYRVAQSYPNEEPQLSISYVISAAEVVDEPSGFQSEKCYHLKFEFEDDQEIRWVRVITADTPIKPNPIIDLEKRIRFRILLTSGSLYVALGIRETVLPDTSIVGEDGGTNGAVEWVGVSSTTIDSDGNKVPIGILVEPSPDWQEIDIDLTTTNVVAFEDGNASLTRGFGVLEHLAFTVVPDTDGASGPFDVYIDEFQQVSDLLVAGTSQGIQLSRDFGRTWTLSRLTETPVHKFYQAQNNRYLWAISANQVFLAIDPAFWFVPQGTTGIQFIHDIVDDSSGNMFISCDKGVYKLDISLINHYSNFRQTQPVNAFTTDCYALYRNAVSSGADEIWVSTEIGVYKTSDGGDSWRDTGYDTSGLVAYQLFNIGTASNPTIIGTTRKHIVRKLAGESNFQSIADFEAQHGIFNIWKTEYFDNRLYVSTGSGVFSNSLGELFTPGISSIPFDRVFGGLDVNGVVGVAFGLDTVDLGTDGQQLFIGQENRLMVAQTDNSLSIKKVYRNKELPSFFVNNAETNIGYIYNAFNKVVCFREPRSIVDVVYATYLPRRTYIAINNGWAQTNPSAEVFVYKNGFPTWLDWKLDNAAILGELQIIEGKLQGLPNLSTFNSLYPNSQQFLDQCLVDIETIKSGGEEGAVLINNTTLVKFIEDYSRFLSLISERLVIDNDLDMPKILLTGAAREDRVAGSRAQIIEDQEEFEAEDSTAITIDTVTGTVDFLTAFAASTDPERRDSLTFDKFDNLQITVFNSNVKNTGEFTHRELENRMEDYNTGLTSHLQRAAVANLIKAGIFFERQHHFMFERYNVSNVQSKFYSAHTNDWYDVLNSTIDYRTLVRVENIQSSRFANVITFVDSDDPYIIAKFWVGTDSDIMEYSLDLDGSIALINVIRPDDFEDAVFVWDIYSYQNSIYVVIEDKNRSKGYIYVTNNSGSTWTEVDTVNLPERIYFLKIINGNLVAGTNKGIFYSDNSFGGWFETDVVLSGSLGDDSPAGVAFKQRIRNVYQGTFLVAESDRWFYTSSQGVEFFALGRITNNNCTVVNKIFRHKNITYIATDQGLYNDGNSLLSQSVQFGLETTLEDSSDSSAALKINDIVAGENALYCCATNSKIYRFFDPDGNGNVWSSYFVPDFGPIQKMSLIEIDDDHQYLIVVSYNVIKVVNVSINGGVFS